MTIRPVGTITGRNDKGDVQIISIGRDDGKIELTSHALDRQHVEAPDATSIEDILTLAKTSFGLVDAAFIPAHGATGGQWPSR